MGACWLHVENLLGGCRGPRVGASSRHTCSGGASGDWNGKCMSCSTVHTRETYTFIKLVFDTFIDNPQSFYKCLESLAHPLHSFRLFSHREIFNHFYYLCFINFIHFINFISFILYVLFVSFDSFVSFVAFVASISSVFHLFHFIHSIHFIHLIHFIHFSHFIFVSFVSFI